MRRVFFPLFLILFIFSAPVIVSQCGGGRSPTGPGDSTPTPGPTPTAAPTVVPEEFIGDANLCEPGDTARIPLEGRTARFTLNTGDCSSSKDNRLEEYTLILYNTTNADIGFSVDSPENIEPFQKILPKLSPADDKTSISQNEISDVTKRAYYDYLEAKEKDSDVLNKALTKSSVLKGAFAIDDEVPYRVRCDYQNPDVFCNSSAIFRLSGTHVELWVDRDVPYEDGIPFHLQESQLQIIADTFDNNIYPLVTTLLGSTCSSFPDSNCPVSDMDGNGKVRIIITPVMNWVENTADPDAEDDSEVPWAYSDVRDMLALSPTNPGANEGETIYIIAPDIESEFNEDFWVADIVGKRLFAWITVMLTRLISYNMHVFINNSTPEAGWIDYGLGGLLADLGGFNVWTEAVWWWLDAPAYESVFVSSDWPTTLTMAAPYLFMLYTAQSQMDNTIQATIDDGSPSGLIDQDLGFLSNLMGELIGTENIENAVTITFDSAVETEFQALFKNWAVALVTSGTGRYPLQISPDFKYYWVRSSGNGTTMSIPDSRLFGPGIAAWYSATSEWASSRYASDDQLPGNLSPNPVGIDLNDENLIQDSSDMDDVTLIENPHEFNYTPGQKLFGVVKPSTANFVRVGGLFEETTDLAIFAENPTLQAFIVRMPDLPLDGSVPRPKVYAESIFGTLAQLPEDLETQGPNPLFPRKLDYPYYAGGAAGNGVIGETITVVGRIEKADYVEVTDRTSCLYAMKPVPDFDKYLLRIPEPTDPNPGPADSYNVAVWLERQADNYAGTSTLNPFLAIVSWDDIPYPYGRPVDYTDAKSSKYGDRTPYRHQYDESGSKRDNPYPDNGDCSDADPGPGLIDGGRAGVNSLPKILADGTDGINGDCPYDSLIDIGHNGYPWTFFGMPSTMFDREILKPIPDDPLLAGVGGSLIDYDPRPLSSFTLDCQTLDDVADTPDDILTGGELSKPESFQQQILAEMSRAPLFNDPAQVGGDLPFDTLAIAMDNHVKSNLWAGVENDDKFYGTYADTGNNIGGRSVVNGENAQISACRSSACDYSSIHVWENRQNPGVFDPLNLYYPYNFPAPPATQYIYLEPGKSYVILVSGQGGTDGAYQLKMRKILPGKIAWWEFGVD